MFGFVGLVLVLVLVFMLVLVKQITALADLLSRPLPANTRCSPLLPCPRLSPDTTPTCPNTPPRPPCIPSRCGAAAGTAAGLLVAGGGGPCALLAADSGGCGGTAHSSLGIRWRQRQQHSWRQWQQQGRCGRRGGSWRRRRAGAAGSSRAGAARHCWTTVQPVCFRAAFPGHYRPPAAHTACVGPAGGRSMWQQQHWQGQW